MTEPDREQLKTLDVNADTTNGSPAITITITNHTPKMEHQKKEKSKQKQKSLRSKRTTVPLEDGWSIVTHTPASSHSSHKHGPRKPHHGSHSKEDAQISLARPRGIVLGMTVPRLRQEYRDFEERWRGSGCRNVLVGMLKGREWGIREAVCLGVGSLSVDWENRGRGMWQVVLFVDVVGIG